MDFYLSDGLYIIDALDNLFHIKAKLHMNSGNAFLLQSNFPFLGGRRMW